MKKVSGSKKANKLVLIPQKDCKTWRLDRPYTYKDFTIPKGFPTDLTSSPRFLAHIIPRWGKYGKAAVIHDYLYASKIKSRKEADKIFFDVMTESDVLWSQKWILYIGSRILGWIPWKYKKYA